MEQHYFEILIDVLGSHVGLAARMRDTKYTRSLYTYPQSSVADKRIATCWMVRGAKLGGDDIRVSTNQVRRL
jgi:hypothetical protein